MSWLGRAMPDSELHLKGPACTADRSSCLCTRGRDVPADRSTCLCTRGRDVPHTWPVPSPAAAPLCTRHLGRVRARLRQPLSRGTQPASWLGAQSHPFSHPCGQKQPLGNCSGSRGSRAQRPHRNPPGDHYRQRGLFKAEGGRGTLPDPQGRHDTVQSKYREAQRTGACDQSRAPEATGERTFLGLVQLGLLLVVPAEGALVLSVRLHTELPPEAFHVVYRQHRKPQSRINRQPA